MTWEDTDEQLFPTRSSFRLDLLWIAAIAALYFVAARFSLSLVFQPEGIAAIWPSSGIFLSAILLTRRRLRPFLAGALFLTDLIAEVLTGTPLTVSLVYAMALTGDAILSSWLLLRFMGGPIRFNRTREVFGFLILSVLFSNGLFALIAAAAAQTLPGTSFYNSWKLWAASDGIGNIIVTPLLISWAFSIRAKFTRWNPKLVCEGAALLVLLALLNFIIFSYFSEHSHFLLYTYLTFPLLIWAALRFGVHGASLASLILAAIAVYFTATGQATGIILLPNLKLDAVITVQLYLTVMAVPSLFLAAVMTERQQIEEKLRLAHERLDLATRAARLGVWDLEIQKNELVWDDRMYELYGIKKKDFIRGSQDWFNTIHPDDRTRQDELSKRVMSGEMEYDTEFRVIWPDGSVHFLKSIGQMVKDAGGQPLRVTGINFDITASKLAEEKILNLLNEKKLLLKEVHHRIKNNMSTVTALLNLQAQAQENSLTKNILLDASGRIRSMMILYDKLYRSENNHALSIKKYIPSIIDEIVAIFPQKPTVKIETRIDDIILGANILSPLGIIIYELINNAMKYAFIGRDEGVITVTASKKENRLSMLYEDNGIGIPESVTLDKTTGFGLKLVGIMVKQINGSITIERKLGTKFIIEFEA